MPVIRTTWIWAGVIASTLPAALFGCHFPACREDRRHGALKGESGENDDDGIETRLLPGRSIVPTFRHKDTQYGYSHQ